MRFHWLAVASKFVLIAVAVKLVLVLALLLTLPRVPSLFRRARA
jgi:hypothetical protein